MNVRRDLIVVVGIAGIVVSLAVYRRVQAKLHERDQMLTQQKEQLLELVAEHQRLSDLLTRAGERTNGSPTEEDTTELQKLRTEAEELRKQTNELTTRLAEERRKQPLTAVATRNGRYGNALAVVSESDSGEYKEQL